MNTAQVICKNCGRRCRRDIAALNSWSGYCFLCKLDPALAGPSIPRMVEVTCKKCGLTYLKNRYTIPQWKGLCQPCARPPADPDWVMVTCSDCGKSWLKWRDGKRVWQGRCRSCAQKLRRSTTSEQQREKARQQVLRQGGVPNARKAMPGIRGPGTLHWKGGRTPINARERATAE